MLSSFDKNIKTVAEGSHEIISFGKGLQYIQYVASPLLTCFAYLILFQDNDSNPKAVFYHALSGIPKDLENIVAKIKSNLKAVDEVIIAISGSPASPPVQRLLQNSEQLIYKLFDASQSTLPIIVVENAPCYSVDTLGNHGITIPSLKQINQSKQTELIRAYLQDLKKDLLTTRFTIINWLGDEVPGNPKGVKALLNHVAKLGETENQKNLELILNNVTAEFVIIKNRQTTRTPIVNDFYHAQLAKLNDLEDALNALRVPYKHHQ